MAVKISFDNTHNALPPTFILASRSGRKLGKVPAYNIAFRDALNSRSELSFRVSKNDCAENEGFWDKITDFKLLWAREWNRWFEIAVEVSETNSTVKNVSAVSLGEAELSQINLYDVEINTETDIGREDYAPTVLFNSAKPGASLLHRILEKAPHYTVKHVDASIKDLQRTFTFNGISILDALYDIAEEIHCLVSVDCTTSDGKILREINVYDLETSCANCGERGEFSGVCPKCGGKNLTAGYGKDTSIFISADNLADDITYSTDNGSVKNCFKLVAGDDMMTAAVINCNPNGSAYLWYISDAVKEDMSPALVAKINAYDKEYKTYQTSYQVPVSGDEITRYNALVKKYKALNKDLTEITSPITGYDNLMAAYYQTIDFALYLQDGMMPAAEMSSTTATKQCERLTAKNLSPVSVKNLETCSKATADSTVLDFAKTLVSQRYRVTIASSSYASKVWKGKFTVTNTSNAEDTATSSADVSVTIDGNYDKYVRQKIDKAVRKTITDDEITDIVELFKLEDAAFQTELKKYSLARLTSFHDCCQSCIDVLIEQGAADNDTWADHDPDLYTTLYLPYHNKLSAIEAEMKTREDEIAVIAGRRDTKGNLTQAGMQTKLETERDKIQKHLDFAGYLGKDLWTEFLSYRREDTYQNDNYVSDGLNTAELFERAGEFLEVAQKEIVRSATLQHSISASLKNLLVMKDFEPILNAFEVGNWLKIRVDDKKYKLRLLEYEVDFDNLDHIQIVFSDVMTLSDGISDLDSVLGQAQSMSSSYGSTKRQAEKGNTSKKWMDNWVEKGLDATNVKIISNADNQNQTWDSHGMLFRAYDTTTGDYDNCQLKIINSTLAVTDDNWKTIKTAVGGYYYFDPETGELKYGYGVNGELVIGKLLLGEGLGIYSRDNMMSFDNDGLKITNGINTFTVNPNDKDGIMFALSKIKGEADEKILWVDDKGMLHISGDGAGLDITMNESVTGLGERLDGVDETLIEQAGQITATNEELQTKYTELTKKDTEIEGNLSAEVSERQSQIKQTARDITMLVSEATSKYDVKDYDISLCGKGAPTTEENIERFPPADFPNDYYMDVETGDLYQSKKGAWVFVETLPLLSTVLKQASVEIADERITLSVQENGVVYDAIADMEESLSSALELKAGEITATVEEVKGRVTELEGGLSATDAAVQALDEFTEQLNEDIEAADKKIDDKAAAISEAYKSEIKQTARSITSTVASATLKYDTTGKTIDIYDYGTPDEAGYPAAENSGKFYLNLDDGQMYKSDGKKWTKSGNPLPLVTETLASQIKQTTDSITQRVVALENSTGEDSTLLTELNAFVRDTLEPGLSDVQDTVDKMPEEIEKAYLTEIEQTKNSITSTVASAALKYDTSSLTEAQKKALICGYGVPTATDYPPADYAAKFYLDLETGILYQCGQAQWSKSSLTPNPLPLITDVLASQITQTASSLSSTITRVDGLEGDLSTVSTDISNLKTVTDQLGKDLDTAEKNIADLPDTIKSTTLTQIQQEADKIKATVAKSALKYDTSVMPSANKANLSAYGYGTPSTTAFPPKDYNGKYYLDLTNGQVYSSNGSSWTKASFSPNPLPLVTDTLASKITQTATSITSIVAGATTKYDLSSMKVTDREKIAAYGHGAPDATAFPPKNYTGHYYLDLDSGQLYWSANSAWGKATVYPDPLPLLETSIQSSIKQNADAITAEVSNRETAVENVKKEVLAQIQIDADSITSIVARAVSKYDTTGYYVRYFGEGEPTLDPADKLPSFVHLYLDVNTGDLYVPMTSEWMKSVTLPVITENLSSKIEQTAEMITSEVSGAKWKFPAGVQEKISIYGSGQPSDSQYPPKDYSGKYYFDTDNGTLYVAERNPDGSYTWTAHQNIQPTAIGTLIQQTQDAIKAVATGTFGSTTWSLDSEKVRIAWNAVSNYIEFSQAAMNIKDSSKKILIQFNQDGENIYNAGTFVGRIGKQSELDKPENKGLTMDLDVGGKYIGWGVKTNSSETTYKVMLAYCKYGALYNTGNDSNADGGLYLGAPLYSRGYLSIAANTKLLETGAYAGIASSASGKDICLSRLTDEKDTSGNNLVKQILITKDAIHVYGPLNMHGWSISNQSDARLKTHIKNTSVKALELINQIRLKEYDWIESKRHEPIGIVAQQIQSFLPDLVTESAEDGTLSIQELNLIPYLIKAIQELYSMVRGGVQVMSSADEQNRPPEPWETYSDKEKEELIQKISEQRRKAMEPVEYPEIVVTDR